MKYFLSPEFNRNLWLKFSWFRAVVAPVVLALFAVTAINLTREASGIVLLYGTIGLFSVIVIVWGCYEASSALTEELRTNTWDFQRMSSITPGQLVFGKLFGCTAYVWYFGILTLLVFAFALGFYHPPVPEGGIETLNQVATLHDTFYTVLYMIFSGLMGQSLALLVSFISMTAFSGRTGKSRQPRSGNAFVIGIVTAYFVFTGLAMSVTTEMSQDFAVKSIYASANTLFVKHPVYLWYGMNVSAEAFITASLAFFLFWFCFGSYRLARAELMYAVTPAGWAGFMATLLLYFRGLLDPGKADYDAQMFSLFMVSMVLTYAVMVFEAADARKYARFFLALKEGRFRRAMENMHKWIISVPFVLAIYVVTLLNVPAAGKYLGFIATGNLMLTTMLFALRDGFIVHFVFRAAGGRHAAFKLVFYYALVYLLLPTMHFSTVKLPSAGVWMMLAGLMRLGMVPPAVPDVLKLAGYYFPTPFADVTLGVVPAALEALAAGLLLGWLIRRQRQRHAAGDTLPGPAQPA